MMLDIEGIKRLVQNYTYEQVQGLRERYGAEIVTPSGSINYEALHHAYSTQYEIPQGRGRERATSKPKQKAKAHPLRDHCPFWTSEGKLLSFHTLQRFYAAHTHYLFVEQASSLCRNHAFHVVAQLAPGVKRIVPTHRLHEGRPAEPTYACMVEGKSVLDWYIERKPCYHLAAGFSPDAERFVLVHDPALDCGCLEYMRSNARYLLRHYASYPDINPATSAPYLRWARAQLGDMLDDDSFWEPLESETPAEEQDFSGTVIWYPPGSSPLEG
jgi:hypothetical protein